MSYFESSISTIFESILVLNTQENNNVKMYHSGNEVYWTFEASMREN